MSLNATFERSESDWMDIYTVRDFITTSGKWDSYFCILKPMERMYWSAYFCILRRLERDIASSY
jgi:hypothetical protein